MGVRLSAAGSFQWFKDTLAPDHGFAELDRSAAEVPAGSNGLVFLPYLTGERTPHPDPTARGAFVGLTVRHRIGHLARAVMEGMAFGLRDSVELMGALMELGEIRLAGGGAQSAVWTRIIADVLDRPVRRVGTPEAAAFGAAMLAATSQGVFASVQEAADALVELGPVIEPGHDAAGYAHTYAVYRELYPALREPFARLSASDT